MAAPIGNKFAEGLGRPTKYKPEYDDQAYKYCLLGATDEQLGEMFDVDKATIEHWKIAYPSFLDSIKRGKYIADAEVANSLYHRALGYEHEEEEIIAYQGIPTIVPTTKRYPPDSTAIIFWLKNRQKDKWRDKHEVGNTNKDGEDIKPVIDLTKLDDDTLRKLLAVTNNQGSKD